MGFMSSLTQATPDVDASQYANYTRQGLENSVWLQNQLKQQALGGGPDVGGMMYRQAADQNAKAAQSLVGSMKGVSPAAAAGLIQNAQTQANTQAAAPAALAKMQQMLGAQGLLGQQALGMSGQGLGYQSGANQANIAAYQAALGPATAVLGGAAQGAGAALAKAHGGEVPPSSKLAGVIRGIDFKGGGLVPGKARVQGDSEKNDTVPAALSPGEIVLPRTVAQGDGAPDKARKFVEHLKRRHGRSGGYKRVVEARKRKGGE